MNMWVIISSFLSGLLGAMGFGGGSVLIIYLTLFASVPQVQAQGINLLFFIPCATVSVIVNIKHKLISFRLAVPMILGGVLGLVIGLVLLKNIPAGLLSKLFGGLVIVLGVFQLFSKKE